MAIHQRPYSNEEDKFNMIALATRLRADHFHVTDLPYRLSSWALDEPGNTQLWCNEDGRLLAWAVLQSPFWTIDYVCDPGDSSLHRKLLEWADQRAAQLSGDSQYGHPCWFMIAFEDQAERIREIEAAGFADQTNVGEDAWSKVWMRREGQAPVKVYDPPAGFIVRPLSGKEEAEAYSELHREVFQSKNMTGEWRRRTIQHPHHRPDIDLIVESPEKRLAAFCIGWIDKREGESLIGQIEPLGSHKNFRHLALGRVALTHVLQRIQCAGAREIFIETDSYRNTAYLLYESLGFEVIRNAHVFRKDYSAH